MKKFISRCIIFLACGFLIVLAFALWPTSTPSIITDQTALKNPELIEKGRYLATLGDCAACHTKPGSATYTGGVPLASPIGTMYSVNITPDKQNGIGEYTLDDFARAVRNGIRQDGATLYPAMPYPSYSRLSDDDITALYAYFQYGIQADATPNQANDISWPLSIRWPVAIWRKVFASSTEPFDTRHYQDAQLARGAYIVESLGHCGTCHTPRLVTLQEQGLDSSSSTYLSGGQIIDNWFTPSLRNEPAGLKNWTEEDIINVLRSGRNAKTVVVASPMNDMIINSSSQWTEDDLKAVAAYLKALPDVSNENSRQPISSPDNTSLDSKADIAFLYQTTCASCHGVQGEGKAYIFPALAENNSVLAPEPLSLIRLVLEGYDVPEIDKSLPPMRMPAFQHKLSDKEIANILTYIRSHWGNQASAITEKQVSDIRGQIEK